MRILDAKNQLTSSLSTIYDDREAQMITDMVMEKLTGWDKIHIFLKKDELLDSSQIYLLEKWEKELLAHRPIQYVIGEAWFMNFPFFVAEGVLIPRPETEELVFWISETIKGKEDAKVLDIGTGSGCIAISLSKLNPALSVWAVDKSNEALHIAEQNNTNLNASVRFKELDILETDNLDFARSLYVIVSNPPYIKELERKDMQENVLAYEPEMALFVPDNDPLLFYRKIAELARKSLCSGGFLFFEINEKFGKEVVNLLSFLGFKDIELKKDLQGKDRMVKAIWLVN